MRIPPRFRLPSWLLALIAVTSASPAAGQQAPVLLRFQLIKSSQTRTTDTSIKAIDAALKELFRFPGYRLLGRAAVVLDYQPGPPSPTMQRLTAEGIPYQLSASLESMSPGAVQIAVKLWGLPGAPAGSVGQLFSTRVSVPFGHTVVLGSTQLAGTSAGTLILAVTPELQGRITPDLVTTRETFTADAVDDPVAYVGGPQPRYPDSLKALKITGRVTLRFVVGVDGKPEAASVQVLSSTHPAFEQSAVEAILGSTFRPATIRGTKVRQMVEQVVRFTPTDRAPAAATGAYTADQVDDPVSYVSGPIPKYPVSLRERGWPGTSPCGSWWVLTARWNLRPSRW